MKKSTCSLLIGTIITGIVMFLLGVDVVSRKRKHSSLRGQGSNLKNKDEVSDVQVLDLINKRIEKLENILNTFIKTTSEASKNLKKKRELKMAQPSKDHKEIKTPVSLPGNGFKPQPISNEIKPQPISNEIKPLTDIKPISSTNQPTALPPLTDYQPIQLINGTLKDLKPLKGDHPLKDLKPLKDQKDNKPEISETTFSPIFSSYKNLNKDETHEEIKETPRYFAGLFNKVHFDSLNWPIFEPNDTAKIKLDKAKDTKDQKETGKIKVLKRELVDLAPTKPEETKNKEKQKSSGFITKSMDEAFSPSDNLTAFSTHKTDYHPIFFTEKTNTETRSLPSNPFISEPSLERIESQIKARKLQVKKKDKTKDEDNGSLKINNEDNNKLKTNNEEINKKADQDFKEEHNIKITNEDNIKEEDKKAINDAINMIFSDDNQTKKKDKDDTHSLIKELSKKPSNKSTSKKSKHKKPKLIKLQKSKADQEDKSLINKDEPVKEENIKELFKKEYYVVPKSEPIIKTPDSLEMHVIKSMVEDLRNSPVGENERSEQGEKKAIEV